MTVEQSTEQQKEEELYIMGEKLEETDVLNSTEINKNLTLWPLSMDGVQLPQG